MSPVERLQAAIEKLEQLRTASPVGPWEADGSSDRSRQHGYDTEIRATALGDGLFDGIAIVFDSDDAELIVTLHRTIDAQLAILRAAVAEIEENRWMVVEAAYEVLALADAILGSDQ